MDKLLLSIQKAVEREVWPNMKPGTAKRIETTITIRTISEPDHLMDRHYVLNHVVVRERRSPRAKKAHVNHE